MSARSELVGAQGGRNTGVRRIGELSLRALRSELRGHLLLSGDEGYDASRKIFNAMIDRRPALIVKCAGVSDVIRTINFARENGLPLAVKGGGHNVAGNALCDDGVVIDFSNMKSIRVDPVRRIARAEPGLTWGEFDLETQAFGLATPGGLNSTTGIAGFTLGGGIGWLMGKHGLTCDNLISADVVTANGDFLTASVDENQDLLWGLKGGGGNFGVVTSFEIRLHPLSKVLAGPRIYPLSEAGSVLRFLGEYCKTIPDELGIGCMFRPTPEGEQVVTITVCYDGSVTEGEKVIEPLRKFGRPLADKVRLMHYTELQRMLDQFWPSGLYCYWKSGFFEYPTDDIVDTIAAFAKTKPSSLSIIAVMLHHGAASRVKPAETAFNHRATLYNLNIQAQWRDPTDTEKNLKWIKDFWNAVEPFMTSRVYVNFLSQEGDERVRAAYGENYERLVPLKNKYDPANFFHFNQNIKPTVSLAYY